MALWTRNAWDHDTLLAHTHEKKKKKNRLHFLSLAAKASETNNTVIFTLLIVDLDSTRVMHVIAIYFAFLT